MQPWSSFKGRFKNNIYAFLIKINPLPFCQILSILLELLPQAGVIFVEIIEN